MSRVKEFFTSLLDALEGPNGRYLRFLKKELEDCQDTVRANIDERQRDVNGWGKLTRWLLANARDELVSGENSSEMAIRLLEKYRPSK